MKGGWMDENNNENMIFYENKTAQDCLPHDTKAGRILGELRRHI